MFGSLPNKQASIASDFYQTSKHENCHICKYLQVFGHFLGGVWAVLIGCESRFLVLSFGVPPSHLNSDATTLAPPINTQHTDLQSIATPTTMPSTTTRKRARASNVPTASKKRSRISTTPLPTPEPSQAWERQQLESQPQESMEIVTERFIT